MKIGDIVMIKDSVTAAMLNKIGVNLSIKDKELIIEFLFSDGYIKAYNEDLDDGFGYSIPSDYLKLKTK